MDNPLAVEYSGKRRYFTYEVFKSLKYGEEDSDIIKKIDQRNETPSGSKSINSEEEEKGEENEKSNLGESISSSSSSEDELDSNYQPDDYISIRNEIK